MKKFVVERNFPGAGNLTPEELREIASTSCEAIRNLDKPYHWVQSFISEDKIYCIHIAENEEVIREFSGLVRLPINTISEVMQMMDPSSGTPR